MRCLTKPIQYFVFQREPRRQVEMISKLGCARYSKVLISSHGTVRISFEERIVRCTPAFSKARFQFCRSKCKCYYVLSIISLTTGTFENASASSAQPFLKMNFTLGSASCTALHGITDIFTGVRDSVILQDRTAPLIKEATSATWPNQATTPISIIRRPSEVCDKFVVMSEAPCK